MRSPSVLQREEGPLTSRTYDIPDLSELNSLMAGVYVW